MLFADLLSLHPVTFLMFFILVVCLFISSQFSPLILVNNERNRKTELYGVSVQYANFHTYIRISHCAIVNGKLKG